MKVTTKQVIKRLKPKVARFGFRKNVIKSLAAHIAENLDVEDDASEEDINTAIDDAIAERESTFALIQSQSMAIFDEWKKEHQKNDDDDDDDDDDDETHQNQKKSKSKSNGNKNDNADNIPQWAKTLIETTTTLAKDVAGIKGDKITSNRRTILEEMLKDSGQFGKTILSQFERMSFKSDKEFDDYIESISDDLEAMDQERANLGLKSLVKKSPKGDGGGGDPSKKVLTDDEIKELVGSPS